MVQEEALCGYVLEEILARLLSENGYRLLIEASQDVDALKDGRHGLLARGRGSDHQADALGELLIPTPFSLPVRLFVEAKFKAAAVGIPDIRNALGVISDVNEYFATDAERNFPLRRYHYRYALFSVSGFTEDAQKYALAHQISLIDLQGPAFADLRATTKQAASELLGLAEHSGLGAFPLNQMRRALRLALGTAVTDSAFADIDYKAAYDRVVQDLTQSAKRTGNSFPISSLANIAANLSEQLDDILLFGFPQGPFVLVLQADNTNSFRRFLRDWPSSEIDVDIRYAPANDKPGEWTIVPLGNRERRDLFVRFGIPPLLESWLLAADAVELERAALAKQALFSTILVFGDSNRVIQLRYHKVQRPRSTTEDVLSAPVPLLRQELASPDLSFSRRQERDYSDRSSTVSGSEVSNDDFDVDFGASYDDLGLWAEEESVELCDLSEPSWTSQGLSELLDRLDDERPVQAEVIRAAAQHPKGQLPRAIVYELAGFEEGRTLRGFIKPVIRITSQLQEQGVVAKGVADALEAFYEHGVQATHLAVPPDVRVLLTKSVNADKPFYVGRKKDGLRGPDDLLNRITDDDYKHALKIFFDSLGKIDGLRIYWGVTGCSLRVAVPGVGPLSVGWIFPPDVPRWMGLADLTLGWDKDSPKAYASAAVRAALNGYFNTLSTLGGEVRPDETTIRGWTFKSAAVIANVLDLGTAVSSVVSQLRENIL